MGTINLTTVAAAVVMAVSGGAAAAADSQTANGNAQEELAALRAQVQALDARMAQLQSQIQASADEAAAAKTQAIKAATSTAAASTVLDKLAHGKIRLGDTDLTIYGFTQAAMGWREHNELAGPSNSSVLTPFPVQAQYHTHEFRTALPQTRLGFAWSTDTSKSIVYKSKIEFDLASNNNAVGAANSGSWTPRLRQGWGEVDNNKDGWHLVFGQTWSLADPNGNLYDFTLDPAKNRGWTMVPGTEVITQPDDGAQVGLGGVRDLQFRFVKEIAPTAAIAISFENNPVSWGGDKGTGLGGNGLPSTLPTPIVSNATFNANTIFGSLGTIPDVITKFAYDPTPQYHFEVMGALRQFRDYAGLAQGLPGAGSTLSGGGTLATFIKAIPGTLDFEGGIGYGAIGTYVGGNTPDVTFDSTGKPVGIMDRSVYATLISHVTPDLNVYFTSGLEKPHKAAVSGSTTATAYGFGNPYGSGGATGNVACMTMSSTSLTATCRQDTAKVWNASLTAFWTLYRGSNWKIDFLPQVQYFNRTLFKDQNGYAPHVHNWALDLPMRFYLNM